MTGLLRVGVAFGIAATMVACGGREQVSPTPAVERPSPTESGAPAGHPYPSDVVSVFVETCATQRGTTAEGCECVAEELTRSVPYAEFQDAEADLRAGRVVSSDLRDAVLACSDR